MSEKGMYKKTVGTGWDNPKEVRRPRENRFFEKEQSNTVGSRNKSKAKGKPRADHKHNYKPILVWRKSSWNNKIYGTVKHCCEICGREKDRYTFYSDDDKFYGEIPHFFQDENEKLTPIHSDKYQKTIFLGGSKTINALTEDIKKKFFKMMNCGYKFAVGDCIGADLQIQKLLSEYGYKKVIVYYSGDKPRINLGGWKTKYISSNNYIERHERQKAKDEQMAKDCDEGFMLLNGTTKGTMANIETLLSLNKKCTVGLWEDKRNCFRGAEIDDEKDFEWVKKFYER